MLRHKIPANLQQIIRQRANYLCEYCHVSESSQYVAFTMEHIIPISKGGDQSLTNLALSCFSCNRRKSDKLKGLDPDTGEIVDLFNPRRYRWRDHFVWSANGLLIKGLTPIGRATVVALDLNRERSLIIRSVYLELKLHPPSGDPILLE
jgi:hypothetical protein